MNWFVLLTGLSDIDLDNISLHNVAIIGITLSNSFNSSVHLSFTET